MSGAQQLQSDARARALQWHRTNTFHHSEFSPRKGAASISVCVPAREEADTIGPIVSQLVALRDAGEIDQVVVIDAASADGTALIAAAAGAEVHQQDALLPEFGKALGKGDALWRSLSVLTGELICFVDADSEPFDPHYVCGVVGPLLERPEIEFVKGCFRRPFKPDGATTAPEGGGRVTELTARPLLNLFYPQLAGIRQPLAGEMAARRTLLERLPFSTGYSVEIALLLDAYAAVGLDGLAQVDLDVRQNRHQSLRALGPMAYAVLRAVADRLEREGRLTDAAAGSFLSPIGTDLEEITVELVERPPMATLRLSRTG